MAVQTAASLSSAVAQVRNYDDEVFSCTENGIFVLPQKCLTTSTESEKKRRNMVYSANTFSLFKIVAATFIYYLALATDPAAAETRSTTYATLPTTLISAPDSPTQYHECGSIDIRHRCDYFSQLNNCTVITGYLLILLISENEICDFDKIRFPELREITDFLLVHDIQRLSTFRNMFPNLTVIRGRRLFLNYAMGMSHLRGLTAVEFPSLIALPRGHIFIAYNKVLCYLDTINFDRLTLTNGENHIIPFNKTICDKIEEPCQGCESGYCWSNRVCQKFENDNIRNYRVSTNHCDDQCLGGCDNYTPQGCAVCRTWSDHGTCVAKCPEGTYAADHFQRCYTREECTGAKRLFIYKNECVAKCPDGYKVNNATKECDSCGRLDACMQLCEPPEYREQFEIYTLSDVERLKGCQILKGNVFINLAYRINVHDLTDNLKQVQEITGYLKVYDSPHLLTLNFFENLTKIRGEDLENGQYSLVLYNNPKLQEIWPLKKNFELVNGGIYIYLNEGLCNRLIRQFKNYVKHDHSLDSIHKSDVEVLCSPEKLILSIENVTHRSFKLAWSRDQTVDEVEILYQPVVGNKPLIMEHNVMNIPICDRIHWQRELIYSTDLPQNETHYYFVVDNLEPHASYRCLVKTFGREDIYAARSELKFITTKSQLPDPPIIEITKKFIDSLSVQWYYEGLYDQMIDFYRLEVYEILDNKDIIDQRNYCQEPLKIYPDFHNEDYDDCCSHRQEDMEDTEYKMQIKQEFACRLDQQEYCERISLVDGNPTHAHAVLTKRVEHIDNSLNILDLQRFRTYAIHIQACNEAGCGSFNIITERTNFSMFAERLREFSACKIADSKEFRVKFKEPYKPNGVVLSYALHFRYLDSSKGPYRNHMRCVTRLQHQRNNHMFVGHFTEEFNQISVRVESLGYRFFTNWKNITKCEESFGEGIPVYMFFIFLCFVGGLGVILTYVANRRRIWCSVPTRIRDYVTPRQNWTHLLNIDNDPIDDRQILVEDFDRVRFLNTPDHLEVY